MPNPDLEVKDILRSIRRQVLDQNGLIEDRADDAPLARVGEIGASTTRIKTYLNTADRLRASLPPVRTYRSGGIARIELWIKGKLKRAMRWIVLDQVNFNSTVHQILAELHAVQERQERILAALTAAHESAQIESRGREQRQALTNEEQRASNEDLRLQLNESAITIDRLRRNFEDRLRKIEEGKA
jgi:hypothetical protein